MAATHAPERTRESATGGGARPASRLGWDPKRDLKLEEWLQHGRGLGFVGRVSGWWIGDWVNYGNAKYGEKYTRAARVTGYDAQTLMNMAYVASRFEVSRRRETLSWSHHAEVAALDPAEQDEWLEKAAEERMSVRCLRQAIRTDRRARSGRGAARAAAVASDSGLAPVIQAHPEGTDDEKAELIDIDRHRVVCCPSCGTHFSPAESPAATARAAV